MRKALAAVAISALALTGCGGTADETTDTPSTSAESTASEPTPSPSPSPSGDKTDDREDGGIEIEIEGDRIEPNGRRVRVEAGEKIRLEIDSDRAGELHVHSAPEQEIAFKQGESVVTLTLDTPGIVDVEEHEAGIVVLQLEVH